MDVCLRAVKLCPGTIFPTPYPQGYGATPPPPSPRTAHAAMEGACRTRPRMAMPVVSYIQLTRTGGPHLTASCRPQDRTRGQAAERTTGPAGPAVTPRHRSTPLRTRPGSEWPAGAQGRMEAVRHRGGAPVT
ncbi:hypothetical protein GCM10010518_44170 [Kitasatospora cinereorecta]